MTYFVQLRSLCLIIALAIPGRTQTTSPPPVAAGQPYQFSTSVQMVVLQTTVLTRKGSYARSLQANDFTVYEDSRQQPIRLFRHADSPVAIGLVIDNSGSMRRKHAAVVAAARTFAKNSNPRDQFFVVSFSDQVTLGLPRTQLSSGNSRELERALPTAPAGGKTALYDALETALSHIHELQQDKKALILISDGGDNASSHTVEQVVSDATNSDVVIYTIGLFGKEADETNPAFMKRIAALTGGEAFLPARPTQASNNCKRIAQTIRNEYTLGYSPHHEGSNEKFRAIQVNVSTRRKEKLIARTRLGYGPTAFPTEVAGPQ